MEETNGEIQTTPSILEDVVILISGIPVEFVKAGLPEYNGTDWDCTDWDFYVDRRMNTAYEDNQEYWYWTKLMLAQKARLLLDRAVINKFKKHNRRIRNRLAKTFHIDLWEEEEEI